MFCKWNLRWSPWEGETFLYHSFPVFVWMFCQCSSHASFFAGLVASYRCARPQSLRWTGHVLLIGSHRCPHTLQVSGECATVILKNSQTRKFFNRTIPAFRKWQISLLRALHSILNGSAFIPVFFFFNFLIVFCQAPCCRISLDSQVAFL